MSSPEVQHTAVLDQHTSPCAHSFVLHSCQQLETASSTSSHSHSHSAAAVAWCCFATSASPMERDVTAPEGCTGCTSIRTSVLNTNPDLGLRIRPMDAKDRRAHHDPCHDLAHRRDVPFATRSRANPSAIHTVLTHIRKPQPRLLCSCNLDTWQ